MRLILYVTVAAEQASNAQAISGLSNLSMNVVALLRHRRAPHIWRSDGDFSMKAPRFEVSSRLLIIRNPCFVKNSTYAHFKIISIPLSLGSDSFKYLAKDRP